MPHVLVYNMLVDMHDIYLSYIMNFKVNEHADFLDLTATGNQAKLCETL